MQMKPEAGIRGMQEKIEDQLGWCAFLYELVSNKSLQLF